MAPSKRASGRTLIGVLTPSSNTILEPVTSAMLSGLPEVTAHFGRFPVVVQELTQDSLGAFDEAPVWAARLLADAQVDVIAWSGTSGGWLGFDKDRTMCERITAATGVPACTSVLSMLEIFKMTSVTKFGLVAPYIHEIQDMIVKQFGENGYECVAERHLNDKGNFSFSEVSQETLEKMIREVAESNPQAILIFCTNLNAAPLVERLESELGIPIYDSVATAVWGALRAVDVNPKRVKGWGSMFKELA